MFGFYQEPSVQNNPEEINKHKKLLDQANIIFSSLKNEKLTNYNISRLNNLIFIFQQLFFWINKMENKNRQNEKENKQLKNMINEIELHYRQSVYKQQIKTKILEQNKKLREENQQKNHDSRIIKQYQADMLKLQEDNQNNLSEWTKILNKQKQLYEKRLKQCQLSIVKYQEIIKDKFNTQSNIKEINQDKRRIQLLEQQTKKFKDIITQKDQIMYSIFIRNQLVQKIKWMSNKNINFSNFSILNSSNQKETLLSPILSKNNNQSFQFNNMKNKSKQKRKTNAFTTLLCQICGHVIFASQFQNHVQFCNKHEQQQIQQDIMSKKQNIVIEEPKSINMSNDLSKKYHTMSKKNQFCKVKIIKQKQIRQVQNKIKENNLNLLLECQISKLLDKNYYSGQRNKNLISVIQYQ